MAENTIILDADVKPLRKQLREATQELQLARQRFGDLSDEAVQAAQKVAGIRDSIDAANEAAQLFDPGKRFQALTTAASTAAGGIAAVQGAMALFGGQSEEVEKSLLKVQGALALSQGLSQLKDIGKVGEQLKTTFKGVTLGMSNFKKALIGTGIGIFVAALGLLIANFDAVKAAIMRIIPGFAAFAEGVGNAINAVTDFIGITSKADRELEKLTKSTALNNEQISNKIKLLTAQGGKEQEIFNLSRKQIEDELALLKETEKTKKTLTEEEQKRRKELLTENAVLAANFYKKVEEDSKAAAEKQAAADKEANEKAKAIREKEDAKTLEAQKILDDARISMLSKQQQELIAVEADFIEKSKKLKLAGISDDGNLEKARVHAIKEINKKYQDETELQEKEFQNKINDIRTEIRLAGIQDENEKARAELAVQQEQRRADLLSDEKLTAEQLTALKLELINKDKQEVDQLNKTIAEEKLLADMADLEKEAAKITTTFERQREIVAEQERINLELKGKTEKERTAIVEAAAEQRKAIDMAELTAKTDMQNKYFDLAAQFGNVMQQFAGKNKKLAIAGVIVEQSAAIGSIISNTAAANAKAVNATPLTGGLPFTAINTLSAGLSIASTIRGAIKAIQGINSATSVNSGGGIQAPSGISASAPQTTSAVPTIGTSPVTALGTMMANQPPLKAYVVESEVTSTQRRVADIERRAGF